MKLECNGKMPDLRDLNEGEIKIGTFSLITSQFTNTLGSDHRLSLTDYSHTPIRDYMDWDLKTVIADLIEFLDEKENFILSDILAMIYCQKQENIFNAVSDTSLQIWDASKALQNLDVEQQVILGEKIEVVKKQRATASANKKSDIRTSEQMVVNCSLKHLFSPPDPLMGGSPMIRLQRALDVARQSAMKDLSIDLTKIDLEQIPEFGTLNLTGCNVILNLNQIQNSLSPAQSEARSDEFKNAIREGNLETVKNFVFVQGIDIDQLRDRDGRTALMIACGHRQVAVAEYLLKAGSNPNLRSARTKLAAIDYLCLLQDKNTEDISLISLLLNDERTEFSIFNAVAIGDYNKVSTFLKRDKSSAKITKESDQTTPLHQAAEYGYASIVALLLEFEADPKAINIDGKTPIYLACKNNHTQVFELLLYIQQDLDLTGPQGKELIEMALRNANLQMLRLLVTNGTPICPKTAVLLEIKTEISKIISKNGIDAPIDKNDSTLLHFCVTFGSPQILQYLLTFGPNLTLPHIFDGTPLEIASGRGHTTIFNIIWEQLKKTSPVDKSLFRAIEHGHTSLAEILIKGGASPDLIVNGLSCLHQAIKEDQINIVRLLLDHNANILVTDPEGNTPLHYAVTRQNKDIVKLLISGVANIKNLKNDTPLSIARATGNHLIEQIFTNL